MCNLSNAQENNGNTYYSPDGIFDKVFDKDNSIYNLSEIQAGKARYIKRTIITSEMLCTSGIFELYFETGCGMEDINNPLHNQRREIICQAFQDISDFINTPLKNSGNNTKIKFWIRSPSSLSLPIGAAGGASSFYNLPAGQLTGMINGGGIVDNEIWKTIHTGIDSYSNSVFPVVNTEVTGGFYHGYAVFNFEGIVNWNLDYDKYNIATGFPTNNIDFYSTIVHEVTHALGFNTLINYNGSSILTDNIISSYGTYYTRFDKNLKTASNTSLLANNNINNGQMYNFFFNTNSIVLFPNCSVNPPIYNGNTGLSNCSTSLKYVGSITVPIYNPPCYEQGSSLSHFEDSCYNGNSNDQYFMMSERASINIAKRFLTTEERQTLCDLGYSLKGIYGSPAKNTYKDYNSIDCSGINLAGVNDGFLTTGGYAYQGNLGSDIVINNILQNDYTSNNLTNLRYEFVQDLYDPDAIISVTTGDANASFTLKSFIPGIHLLRYVPFDVVTGQRGNITYIYVNVLNICAINNLCSLVKNGNFEEHYNPPTSHGQIFKSCGWQNASYRPTCDYLNSDSTISSFLVPCNVSGIQTDKITNNHGYIGMFIGFNRPELFQNTYSESVKTELTTTLLPNTPYKLTFDVSIAEKYRQRSIKFQAFITDTNLELTTGGIIPSTNITSNTILLTNPTFSNLASAAANGWETITFNFTTGNNPNLKYLYLGGLSNVEFHLESDSNTDCNGNTISDYNAESYYYLDNVDLIPNIQLGYIDAINDDLSNYVINGSTGGVTPSIYVNDIFNGSIATNESLNNVGFSLVSPISISGATINNLGLIYVPSGTPSGTYTLTYKLNVIGNCTISDTATVIISVNNIILTPNLVAGIRANDLVEHIKLQSTSKIIISGIFTKYNNIVRNTIARLNNDLTLDTSFNCSGETTSLDRALDVEVQSDDKIIVVGQLTNYADELVNNMIRLNNDGTFDSSFNSGNIGTSNELSRTNNVIYSCAIQSDGKILLGGDFYSYNEVMRLGITRLMPNGDIDLTFNPIQINTFSRAVISNILIQPDGKILLEGIFSKPGLSQQIKLIRLEANGAIDTTFLMGNDLFSVSFTSSYIGNFKFHKMALQSTGKILVAGSFTKYNGTTVKGIVRLMPNGQVDPSFNVNTGVDKGILDIFVEPNTDKILISGEFSTFNNASAKRIARLSSDGMLDLTFTVGLGTTSTSSPATNMVLALKQQPDGKIIVGGKFTTFNNIVAGNITRIYGNAGAQAKSSVTEYQSEPEIDSTLEDKITFYPNPSSGIYYFNLTEEDTDTKIQIFNLLGEQVFDSLLLGSQENRIDLSHLAQGCYLIKLSNYKSISTQKLIKN